MAQNITLMACVADALLIDYVRDSPSPWAGLHCGHVHHHYNHAVHFGAYLERIRPRSKSTHFIFRARILLVLTC